MKVLQINCVYPNGSTGKITEQIHKGLLERGEESIVCYGRGESVHRNSVYKTSFEIYSKFNNLISRITGLMYGGCKLSTWYLIRLIKRKCPDIVHLQCINGYFVNIYDLLRWLKNNDIKTIVTLHAEFMYTANCGHAFECDKWMTHCGNCERFREETKSWFFDRTSKSFSKMRDAFKGFENNCVIVSVSPWLHQRAIKSPIIGEFEQTVVYNGIDENIFKYSSQNELKQKYGYYGKNIILHVTAEFCDLQEHPKGGYYILELAKRMSEFEFVIAGNSNVQNEIPSNVKILGKITNQKVLAEYYSLADLTVIASKRETFSMPCSESLCCGTPVVGFKAGAPEQIALDEYSEFVEYGNIDDLEIVVRNWILRKNAINRLDVASTAKEKYSSKRMIENYYEIYKGLL